MGLAALKDPVVYRDGVELAPATWRADPQLRHAVARGKWVSRTQRIRAGGILAAANTISPITPVLHTYTTGSGLTETSPAGAQYVLIEATGSPAGGAGGSTNPGGGGGAGGYSETQVFIIGGQTLTYTVGATAGVGASGAASSVSSGTKTITTMTANGGTTGGTGSSGGAGAQGAGGTATGGTLANTTGNGSGGITTAGAGGTVGVHQTGHNGGTGITGSGTAGTGPGIVTFYYT